MAHDVFISYASEDKPIADGVCGVRNFPATFPDVPGEPGAEGVR